MCCYACVLFSSLRSKQTHYFDNNNNYKTQTNIPVNKLKQQLRHLRSNLTNRSRPMSPPLRNISLPPLRNISPPLANYPPVYEMKPKGKFLATDIIQKYFNFPI